MGAPFCAQRRYTTRGQTSRGLLYAAGFAQAAVSASYDSHATPESTGQWSLFWASELDGKMGNHFVEQGWVDRHMVAQMSQAWQAWQERPDAFLARAFCEGRFPDLSSCNAGRKEIPDMIRVPFDEACRRLTHVFRREGVPEDDAATLAEILATNSLEGSCFPWSALLRLYFEWIERRQDLRNARPSLVAAFAGWEQWDGNRGPGPLNALRSTDRAMELAVGHGVGMVALRNTTHWTRAGYYGQRAARAGFGYIGWTNTYAVMPPWGSSRPRLGNNPIVFASATRRISTGTGHGARPVLDWTS